MHIYLWNGRKEGVKEGGEGGREDLRQQNSASAAVPSPSLSTRLPDIPPAPRKSELAHSSIFIRTTGLLDSLFLSL